MTSSVIITIVVILAIIVIGGFLLYFLGDLLMGISNKKRDNEIVKNRQNAEQKALEQRVKALEDSKERANEEQVATVLYNGGVVEDYNPEEEKEEAAVEETANEEVPAEEETAEEAVETEETEEETQDDADTAEYIRQRRLELMERLAKMQQENEEETEETEETTEETVETEEAPVEETPAEEPVEEVVTEETQEVAEEAPVEEVAEVAEEVPAEEPVVETVVVKVPVAVTDNELTAGLTLEELEAKLAEEQDKLKANEKELRQCKKEYLPLRRVKNTLENDEKKLRRKEALVAKQKVVLYGVNNYADIDEEKAKKLAEDLDLLEGLKLSVQNAQDLLNKNEERYPLLEQIYTLLTSQNEVIKKNVKDYQDAIDSLKGENPTDTDAE